MYRVSLKGKVAIGIVSIFILGASALGAFGVVNAATSSSCIITLFGKQYDVTALQASHTGGNIFACGTDMTATYQAMHGTDVSRMIPYLVITPTPVPTATPIPTLAPTPIPTVTPSPTVAPTPTPTPGSTVTTGNSSDTDDEDNDDGDEIKEKESEQRDNESRGHHNLSRIVAKQEQQISRRASASRD